MITLDTMTLPEDLIWTNEFSETAVVHDHIYSLTGKLIVFVGIKAAGRPMLLSGTVDSAWLNRGLLKQLNQLQESNIQMTLTLHDSRSFDVIFDYQKKGITAKPIIDFNDPEDDDEYQIIIPFIQV